jgi:SpoVK/Ycf46/Vps4 family AAA+-type ATPase
LSVWRGGERFEDLVGLTSIKTHLGRRQASRTKPGVVLFIDEIDKALANVENDTSGVRMYQLQTLLTRMENGEWRGLIALGVAGGGKTMLGKAFANECGVPLAMLDLGATESKYVGESEANIIQAMDIVESIGRGNVYVMATSNNASVMRPELQRRFTDGMWMFDLMSDTERAAAWTHYVKKYGLTKAQTSAMPSDNGWTGAEVRNCCRYAWDTGCTLAEAAMFIVPMAQSRAEDIEALRRFAHGRLLDASKPGPYQYTPGEMVKLQCAIALAPTTESVN